jgi:hypothetical protein
MPCSASPYSTYPSRHNFQREQKKILFLVKGPRSCIFANYEPYRTSKSFIIESPGLLTCFQKQCWRYEEQLFRVVLVSTYYIPHSPMSSAHSNACSSIIRCKGMRSEQSPYVQDVGAYSANSIRILLDERMEDGVHHPCGQV